MVLKISRNFIGSPIVLVILLLDLTAAEGKHGVLKTLTLKKYAIYIYIYIYSLGPKLNCSCTINDNGCNGDSCSNADMCFIRYWFDSEGIDKGCARSEFFDSVLIECSNGPFHVEDYAIECCDTDYCNNDSLTDEIISRHARHSSPSPSLVPSESPSQGLYSVCGQVDAIVNSVCTDCCKW